MFCRALSHDDIHTFAVLFKIPGLFAEALSAYLIFSIWRRSSGLLHGTIAFAAYGWALGSILVSSFHCNTDAVCAAFTLLAVYFSGRRAHLRAGAALAGALSVKIIPILLAPLLFSRATERRDRLAFLGSASLVLIPYLPLLGKARTLLRSIVGYAPTPGDWGFAYFFDQLKEIHPLHHIADKFYVLACENGKQVIIGSAFAVVAFGFWTRASVYKLAAIVFLGFFVFSPGFGIQYVISLAPLLFAYDVGIGLAFASLSGLFAGIIYASFLVSSHPFEATFGAGYPLSARLVGFACWAYAGMVLARLVRREASRASRKFGLG
jgi:hypothetical protein